MRLLVVSVVMRAEEREYAEKLKERLEQTIRADEADAYVRIATVNVPGK